MDTSTTSVSSLDESTPLTEGAQPTGVLPDTIGTNIGVAPTNTPQAIPANSFASLQSVGLNSQAIAINSEAIDVNTRTIAANRVLIDQTFAGIGENATAIQASLSAISDVEEGLAAVAALPDMFLARDESFAASGGAVVIGDETVGKVQVRWAK